MDFFVLPMLEKFIYKGRKKNTTWAEIKMVLKELEVNLSVAQDYKKFQKEKHK